jgi:2'-hydroxyisoflavone reductase
MPMQRREFIQAALVAGAGLAIGRTALARREAVKTSAPLKILILGGTGFLGPACMKAALTRGHTLTLFNRGRLETLRKEGGRPTAVPEGVEILYGNRDPEKFAEDWKDDAQQNPKGLEKRADNPKGLSQLEGRSWDAVIDTSAYFPRMARASATLLAPKVKQYVFISTISVYADPSKPITESATLGTLSDPNTEEMGANYENYGPGKAACEAACEAAMPGRVTNIRPGFIVGERDSSSRFLFWPLRVRAGGEMLIPGEPTDPIQVIDVHDLAAWIVHTIENSITGVFNATGPATPMGIKDLVEGCKKGAGADTTFTWASEESLSKLGNGPDGQPLYREGDFPLYIPPQGEGAQLHRCDISKALSKGLKFRPLDETARSALAWYDSLPKEFQAGMARFALTEERHAALLAAWKKAQAK